MTPTTTTRESLLAKEDAAFATAFMGDKSCPPNRPSSSLLEVSESLVDVARRELWDAYGASRSSPRALWSAWRVSFQWARNLAVATGCSWARARAGRIPPRARN
jgi:hypothetical protein